MNEKPVIPSRTVRAWCVVDNRGGPLMNTLRPTRSRAIIAFAHTSDRAEWRRYKRLHGVQVVRCTIATGALRQRTTGVDSMNDAAEAQPYTSEEVKALAAFLGWKRIANLDTPTLYAFSTDGTMGGMRFVPLHWNPFTDANTDLQVLERAREVWVPSPLWGAFHELVGHGAAYTVGTWARAALDVIRLFGDAYLPTRPTT